MRVVIPCRDGRELELPLDRTALLVIDMQRDFCCHDGYGASTGCDVAPVRAIIPAIRTALDWARGHGLAVVHTREGHPPDLSDLHEAKRLRSRNAGAEIGAAGPLGRFLVRGEFGHDFVDELPPLPGEVVIDKPGYGAFYRTELQEALGARSISHLLLAGVTTEVCVSSTLREAADRGYFCLVLEDACAAYRRDLHDAALAMVETEGGIFGWVSSTSCLIAAAQVRRTTAAAH